jgi:hypothetical protein
MKTETENEAKDDPKPEDVALDVPRLVSLLEEVKEFEIDHTPNGYPAITMDKVSILAKGVEEARWIIRELLKVAPSGLSCDHVHHDKNDQHERSEPCPVVARYFNRIAKAEEFITG